MSHIPWVSPQLIKLNKRIVLQNKTFDSGDFGGIRAATVVQPFLSELGMISLPVRVALPAVHKKFDEGGQPNDARFQDNVLRLVNELSWYVDALCNKKNMSQDIPK